MQIFICTDHCKNCHDRILTVKIKQMSKPSELPEALSSGLVEEKGSTEGTNCILTVKCKTITRVRKAAIESARTRTKSGSVLFCGTHREK